MNTASIKQAEKGDDDVFPKHSEYQETRESYGGSTCSSSFTLNFNVFLLRLLNSHL